LWTWGTATNGRLGNGTTTPDVLSPAQIGSDTDWTAITAGNGYSMGIRDGKLFTWGSAANGRLGNGTTTPAVTSPAQIGSDTNWDVLGPGPRSNHSMAIK
jgi:alpha-tubulin suppressor-like RCC1 family protein